MQSLSPPSTAGSKSTMPPPPLPQPVSQQGPVVTYLNMLEGPVVTVVVGSSSHTPSYTLPVALLCHHSQSLGNEIRGRHSVLARADSNKKRKLSAQNETTTVKIEKVDEESDDLVVQCEHQVEEMIIKLTDVDPMIFGLFLKYMYIGNYPDTVDARPGLVQSSPYTTHNDTSYAPAKTSMPPPASTKSRKALLNHTGLLPAPHPNSSTPLAASFYDNTTYVPPSVHAYVLAARLYAAGFMNQALNHIYKGMGIYFALTPSLVTYIWRHTHAASTLRRLILDILVTHWSSNTSHIIAKHPALSRLWNEVFDVHRDLRHDFTTGLQAGVKVAPAQAYFVSSAHLSAGKEDMREEAEVVKVSSGGTDTSAAEAAARIAAKEQNATVGGKGRGEE